MNKSITEIDLSYNIIKDNGAIAIAKALFVNKSIIKIDLIGNQLNYDGALSLTEALKVNSIFRNLDLPYDWRCAGERTVNKPIEINKKGSGYSWSSWL